MTFKQLCDWAPLSSFFTKDTLSGQQYYYYYYYYLLTFLVHAYLAQTAQVPKLLDGGKILAKILTLWVGRNNGTDDRHRRTGYAIRRT